MRQPWWGTNKGGRKIEITDEAIKLLMQPHSTETCRWSSKADSVLRTLKGSMLSLWLSDPRLHDVLAYRKLPQRVGLRRQNLLGFAKGAQANRHVSGLQPVAPNCREENQEEG